MADKEAQGLLDIWQQLAEAVWVTRRSQPAADFFRLAAIDRAEYAGIEEIRLATGNDFDDLRGSSRGSFSSLSDGKRGKLVDKNQRVMVDMDSGASGVRLQNWHVTACRKFFIFCDFALWPGAY